MTSKRTPAGDTRTPPSREISGLSRGATPVAETCRRFRIAGRVQGVFFRDSTRQVARKLGLRGYANNLPDGSVEVVACGGRQAVDSLGQWLQSGPPRASVASVEATDMDYVSFRNFTIG